jgi:hypothetical protein
MLLKEAKHRAARFSKELHGSPKHRNPLRTEAVLDHRNEAQQRGAQVQAGRQHFERAVAANRVFWRKLRVTFELELSCVVNNRCPRMFRRMSSFPLRALMASTVYPAHCLHREHTKIAIGYFPVNGAFEHERNDDSIFVE